MQRPNILYLHSHDTGRFIQPYGHAVATPHLQRFAERGVLFRNAFCTNPTCSPSRASLLTGQCAHSSGMLGLAHRGFALNDYRQHLAAVLKSAGYQCHLFGVQHVAPNEQAEQLLPYDTLTDWRKNMSAARIAPQAQAFLKSRPAQPFFLSVGFSETHRPFPEPGPHDDPRYTSPLPTLPDTPETRYDTAAFNTMARQMDEGMGRVLAALEQTGLADNTLVIVTTDHGAAFPGFKCNLTDLGIGVMLMMRCPSSSNVSHGKVIDAMVSHVDLFPTICDLLDIPHPAWLQGASLLPLLRGQADRVHDEVFAEVNFHAAIEPMRCVRTERHKYIRRYAPRCSPVLPNCDDGPSKTCLLNHGWRNRAPEDEQLYDLFYDPLERDNLAAQPAMTDTLAELRGRLERWMRTTDDPILAGSLTPPPGAFVNDPDHLSPTGPTKTPCLET